MSLTGQGSSDVACSGSVDTGLNIVSNTVIGGAIEGIK